MGHVLRTVGECLNSGREQELGEDEGVRCGGGAGDEVDGGAG